MASEGEARAAVNAGIKAPSNDTIKPQPIAIAIGAIPTPVLGIEIPKSDAVDWFSKSAPR
jgi:hypothetical protein